MIRKVLYVLPNPLLALADSKVLFKESGDTDVVLLQDTYPGLIMEYRSTLYRKDNGEPDDINENNCPPVGASIVIFPLKPKPHECDTTSWVTDAWIGGEDVLDSNRLPIGRGYSTLKMNA